MDINIVNEQLKGVEYSFLRENKKLKDNIILLTLGGSLAYGTNIETNEYVSDIDLRGIRINSVEEMLSMDFDDKPLENRELDVVIYPLKQIITLLSKCNPNTIELLGTKEEHIFVLTEEGKMLRNNKELFLSQQAGASFSGYATAQLRRLENALSRGAYPQGKKEEHILKAMKNKLLLLQEKICIDEKDKFELYVKDSEKVGFDKEIYVDINIANIPFRDFRSAYSEIGQIVNDFDKLNHRNSKKDETHLLKHAMHLIRLLNMGTEILKGEGINTYRSKDRDLLLDIRNGKYTYEEIFEMTNLLEKEFVYAQKNTNLPKVADLKKIKELTMELNKKILLNSFI